MVNRLEQVALAQWTDCELPVRPLEPATPAMPVSCYFAEAIVVAAAAANRALAATENARAVAAAGNRWNAGHAVDIGGFQSTGQPTGAVPGVSAVSVTDLLGFRENCL